MRATPELLAAVEHADRVVDRYLEPAGDLCMTCRKEDRVPFADALRPWRARRLELPATELASVQMGHGSAMVHGSPTRLRWFVPSFLAQSLRVPDWFVPTLRCLAELVHEARMAAGARLLDEAAIDVVFTPEQGAALARFATLALDRAAREGRLDDVEAIATLAAATELDAGVLASVWLRACDEDPTAVVALLDGVEAVGAGEDALRAVLVREPVRAWLERAFFAATEAEARARFSRAERALAGGI